ncbi:MAG: hypothetical protein ACOC5D_06385 [Thermoplasmatota archaeon]
MRNMKAENDEDALCEYVESNKKELKTLGKHSENVVLRSFALALLKYKEENEKKEKKGER